MAFPTEGDVTCRAQMWTSWGPACARVISESLQEGDMGRSNHREKTG